MNTLSMNSLVMFLLVIVLIPLCLWLLKRTPLGGGPSNAMTRTVSTLPISPNQRIMTIEVGAGSDKRWLVLGVTLQQITTLHTMAPQEEGAGTLPLGTPAAGFAQLMNNMLGKRTGADR